MKRRDFLKTASTIGAGMALAACTGPISETKRIDAPAAIHNGAKMKLSWASYEILLAHTFTVASLFRTTTPDVQVEIE